GYEHNRVTFPANLPSECDDALTCMLNSTHGIGRRPRATRAQRRIDVLDAQTDPDYVRGRGPERRSMVRHGLLELAERGELEVSFEPRAFGFDGDRIRKKFGVE